MAKEREQIVGVDQILSATFQEKQIQGLPFEQGMKLLTELVAKVESGTLPLEQALQAYERGALLLQTLRGQLQGAEERLKVISKRGKPIGDEEI